MKLLCLFILSVCSISVRAEQARNLQGQCICFVSEDSSDCWAGHCKQRLHVDLIYTNQMTGSLQRSRLVRSAELNADDSTVEACRKQISLMPGICLNFNNEEKK